ncbi:MAG: hypothetical protein WC709_04155 [Thermoleophilia bacterium]
MRRLSAIFTGLLLAILALPAVASGVPSHAERAAAVGPIGPSPAPVPSAAAGPRFVPLPRALAGNATVLVHVYDYNSNPEVGAPVGWWVTTDTEQAFGSGVVDAAGLVTFTGVPGATANNGEIAIYPTSEDAYYDIWNLGWPDPAGTDMGVQPGRITLQLNAGGDWAAYGGQADVDVYSQNGDAYQLADSLVTLTDASTSGVPLALGGSLMGGAVYFWSDQGTELPLSGQSVSPATTTTSGVEVDQASCQRITNSSWASGKPGTVTKLSFQNFPAGWVNWMYGQSEAGGVQPVKTYSDWTSPGGTSWVSRSFTIPTTAKAGFTYTIHAEHADGPLLLSEPFQVCTFTPSRTAVSRTGTVRFSGRVPFNPGYAKKLIVYKRTTTAGQPTVKGGFTSWKGWTKVGTCMTDTSGRYTTKSFRPGRTSWYVLWYPRDSKGHWGAWTSVAKVAVR